MQQFDVRVKGTNTSVWHPLSFAFFSGSCFVHETQHENTTVIDGRFLTRFSKPESALYADYL